MPLFLPGELPFRGSIGAGYASMAPVRRRAPQPVGLESDPVLRPADAVHLPAGADLLAAALDRLFPTDADYTWRLLTATLTCLGPSTLYLFVRFFTRSRGWALATALAYTFFSPLYGLVRTIDKDRGLVQLPWRIQVFAKYGEGPHNAGLTLLPRGADRRLGGRHRTPLLAHFRLRRAAGFHHSDQLGGRAGAGVVLPVFACWPVLARPEFRAWRMLAAAGLAWLLAAFWLTPSVIRTILFNWPQDAFGYVAEDGNRRSPHSVSPWRYVAVRYALLHEPAAPFIPASSRSPRWFSAGPSSGTTGSPSSLIPESRRYAVEFEFFLIPRAG